MNSPCVTTSGGRGVCLSYLACKDVGGVNGNTVVNNNGGCGALNCCESKFKFLENLDKLKIVYFQLARAAEPLFQQKLRTIRVLIRLEQLVG